MELKKDHIRLDQLGKDYPFHAPDGYFDQFSEKIMALVETESKLPKPFFFSRFLRPAIGLAASFLIIMGLLFVPGKFNLLSNMKSNQYSSLIADEEYFISYPLSDHAVFESLESNTPDDTFDNDQLETVLLASVSEYELIDLTN